MITEKRKLQYWLHFTDKTRKGFRPRNITDLRLGLIKEAVLDDSGFWHDLMIPRESADKTPDELMNKSPLDYRDVRSKFWTLMRRKIERHVAKSRGRKDSSK
jgi:hypothetical protein